jgi:thiol-disulfide isomerase/thioredoxin
MPVPFNKIRDSFTMQSSFRKTIRPLCTLIAGLLIGNVSQAASFKALPTPAPLPEQPALLSLDNEMVDLPSGPLFINIWATWCKPCIDELPALNVLKASYGDTDIAWIALNYGDSLIQVNRFIETTAIDLTVILDATTLYSQALPMLGLPVTFLVDRDGKVRYQLDGYAAWEDPALIREWETLLSELIR